MMRKIIAFWCFLSPILLNGQVDDEFWLAAPNSTEYVVGDEDKIEITITAMQATVVTFEKPATGWSFTTPTIGALSSITLSLADLGLNMSDIETPPQSLPLSPVNPAYNNGLRITSNPGLITVSYKLSDDKCQDQVSLKGGNALGQNFWVSTQNLWQNIDNNHYNGFTIVATEDGTNIEISRNNIWTAFPGPFPATETLTLNAGQTFTVQSLDNTVARHINGVHVTSDKDIAITFWDDEVAKQQSAGKFRDDYASDQLVPVNILGTDYIVMKGGLRSYPGNGGESVFITGTVNNTTVVVQDSSGHVMRTFIVNAGQVIYDTIIDNTTFIHSSEPIMINHYTSIFGSQQGYSVAASVLPPVGPCTGSHDVIITRSAHAGDRYLLNILATNDTLDGSIYKNKAVENFYITTAEGITQIPPSYFYYSSDSAYVVLKQVQFQSDFLSTDPVIDVGQTALIQNRIAKFHLGVLEGHENQGSKYGYFSDYGGQSAHAGIGGPDEDGLHVQCNLNPVRLVVTGGRTYQWWVAGPNPADSANSLNFLSALNVAEPIYYPDTVGVRIFKVRATQLCGGLYENTLVVHTVFQPRAYFSVEADEVCSPDSLLITHGITNPDVNMDWYFNFAPLPGLSEISNTALPYYHVLPQNNGDTLYSYNILLQTNYMGACSDMYSRTITIKPEISADFEFIGDSVSCHPLYACFKNLSTGNIDSTSFFWDFGDYSISYEEDSVLHTYNNYSMLDTTFYIRLITRSPFDCLDTATAQVIVYPRVKALFSTTPNQGCSPLTIDINPVNTTGADSLFWNIDYFYNDSSFIRTNSNAFNITHNDTSVTSGTDTLTIQMIAKNQFGCSDTTIPHHILVFPAATADFEISDNEICDGDSITYINNSTGYHLDYSWDLGDGTAPNDSIPADKPYYNFSNADRVYLISLTTFSEHSCFDYKDTLLTVHPFIDANFGISYVKNCSPLNLNIADNSYRAHNYWWDMDDGTVLNTPGNFSYLYVNNSSNNDTTFTIELKVSNNEGCYDSISRDLTIRPKVVALMDLQNKIGCSPLTTTFRNLSTGGSYYVWNLGGNSVRTDTIATDFVQNYVNQTANDISYPISLTARNDAGCDSTVYDTTRIFTDIMAGFYFAQDSSCSPFTPVITNSSTSGAKVFEWYRNNVLFSSDKTPVLPEFTNITDTPDNYTYTLITYGYNDLPHRACADTHTSAIQVFPELHPQFTLGNLASCQPLATPITNTSNLIDSTNFLWYLDNYIYSDLSHPGNLAINNFTDADKVHTLRLNGSTNHGCQGTYSNDVTVYAYIDANFTIDRPAICSGDTFSINRGNTRGLITNYLWNFAGTADNRADVQFNYSFDNLLSAPAKKIINLTVSNANCDSTWTDSITVYPLVTADFDIPVAAACQPHNTSFINNSTNADYYRWSFGDGVSSTDANPSHIFLNYDPVTDRTFDVQLIAESGYHCSDTVPGQVTVFATPDANFFLPKSVSCPPFDFSVINSSSGSNLNYLWNLGDEASSTNFAPTYTFDNTTSGVLFKPIDLKVTSDKGCVDSLNRTITIYPGVNVNFTASPLQGCSPLSVNFMGDTTNVQQMVWYVDGSIYSTQIDPTGLFLNETANNLQHDVKIIAYSRYNCIDSSQNTITVYPTPSVDFLGSPVPAQYDSTIDLTPVTFSNLTRYQSNWNYNWDFGDGNLSTNANSGFQYNYGEFFWGDPNNNFRVPVMLVASNKVNSICRDTISREIIILPPVPLVEIGENIAGCIPLTIDFSAFTKYAYSEGYEWSFGDGQTYYSSLSPQHVFTRPGTYTVKLSILGDGGPAADYKIITVYPQPIADFSFNDTVVFVASQTSSGDPINFYNQTQNATSYNWYFDSEDFTNNAEPDDTIKDPTWVYREIGTYYPVLVAYSVEGCIDTLIHPIAIHVLGEGLIKFPTGFFVDPNSAPADEYNSNQASGNLYLFYPQNNGVVEYKLEIYNRWGVLVFETEDINQGWNGYVEGIPAKQDVYAWRAKGRFSNGQPFDIAGDVTLMRAPVNVNP